MNPLTQLAKHGQSVWLDFVTRSLIASGELARMIAEDDVRGVTSNPAIFEKAIGHSAEYDDDLIAFERQGDHDVGTLFEHLAVGDIRAAADVLRPVYDRTGGIDGYISLEVSPYTAGTIAEARRLWKDVGKPNLMVKVPGTHAGVPAIRTLIGEGLNINVTLLFGVAAYDAVADAYMSGLEDLLAKGGDISRIGCVASFFVSRIDVLLEKQVAEKLKTAPAADAEALKSLLGGVAIANAKVAYEHYKIMMASPRWKALAAKGAKPQRLLWASTGVKSKEYRDTLYVEQLVGPDTVNTMPPATMDAVRDHGEIMPTIETDLAGAKALLAKLPALGLSLDAITDALVIDGVQQFADAADKLYGAVAGKRTQVLDGKTPLQTIKFGDKALEAAVATETESWRHSGKIRKLWAADKTVWTGTDEDKWLGWLSIVAREQAELAQLEAFAQTVKSGGFTDVVLLGMGGSSLGPEVLAEAFGRQSGWPQFHMLDSTDPAQVARIEAGIALSTTLFIVSSKSGSTLEPNIFKQYFFERVQKATGAAGKHFVAVTDPGSHMEKVAKEDGFAHIFYGDKTIGGRYSVLSKFGLAPAAAMGLNVSALLSHAAEMVYSCGAYVPPTHNPGVALGLALGVAGKHGRDKVTIIASPGIAGLGAWLEQLIAESTGKQGLGLIPIDAEKLVTSTDYGKDRFFAYLELAGASDPAQQAAVSALEAAGHPVVRIQVPSPEHIGQEFFRWEIATAVAGSILGINPFDQPDVEASKLKTRALTDEYEQKGSLPGETPLFSGAGISLYTDATNAAALGKQADLAGYLRAHFARVKPGDYVALLAYIDRTTAHQAALQALRAEVLEVKHVATCLGFGPRFLHSTGQAYKGGPNSGVFLQITCDDAKDLEVPGQTYSFGVVKAAQARGDLGVLVERGRRALRVHLGADVDAGLKQLASAMKVALA
jgi:transaldolase/glucose-6-phosphate isomerase